MSVSKTRISRLAPQAMSTGPRSRARGRSMPEDAAAGQREHVPLGHQVAGEEHGQRELGELARLDAESADD